MEQAGATMAEVVASVKRVTDIVAEISSASQEQSAGIEQVNQAIAQMDEVTQQNAALVEEAAAAAQSLQDQAATLSKVVSVFNIGQAQVRAVGDVKRPAPAAKRTIDVTPRTTALQPRSTPKLVVPKTPDNESDWEQF